MFDYGDGFSCVIITLKLGIYMHRSPALFMNGVSIALMNRYINKQTLLRSHLKSGTNRLEHSDDLQ